MPHESRLNRELRLLLQSRRVAALGTLNDDATPFVSMVPYAVAPTLACLVIHVSGLAAHARNLTARPNASLMVMQAEQPGEPVHALPRVTLDVRANEVDPGSQDWQACRAAYLGRFPEAEPMTQLGDFRFLALEVNGARQVAGFGAARSVDAEELRQALGS
jgi:putative heme iron utilization protein